MSELPDDWGFEPLGDEGGDAPCWAHLVERHDIADRRDLRVLVVAFYRSVGDYRPAERRFSHTDTCAVLSPVNGSRRHPAHRSRNVMPASRAMRSSSEGHT